MWPVRVKGEMSLRNDMCMAWLAEWHNHAECNICWMTERNKLSWKVNPFLAPINLQKQRLFKLCGLDYDDNQKATKDSLISHSRLAFFAQPQRWDLFRRAAWHYRYYSTDVGHWRKDVLEGHAPFCFNFSAKVVCTINSTGFLPSLVEQNPWESRTQITRIPRLLELSSISPGCHPTFHSFFTRPLTRTRIFEFPTDSN